MPIRPENKDRYPDDWKEIRAKILERANHCCEFCGVKNYAVGYWEGEKFVEYKDPESFEADVAALVDGKNVIKIVLTIAHLDHTPENCNPANLKAICQRCHNRYDAPMRAAGRVTRRKEEMEKNGQTRLLAEEDL